MLPLALVLASTQAHGQAAPASPPDPYLLPIGTKGTVNAAMGYTSTKSGQASTADQIAADCDNVQFLLVGESHATPSHHKAQAELIQALVKRGRFVTVGMEMFTRDKQLLVNGLSYGNQSVDDFQISSDWKTQWGHNFDAYRPVLQTIKDNQLRVVALNVPRDMVRKASREGWDKFDEFQKKWVPYMDLTNKNHEMVVSALLGGHPLNGTSGINMMAGQTTWDIGMAKTALDWQAAWPYKKNIMVILAGSGHVMYGQGINFRLFEMQKANSKSVVCIHDAPGRPVSRGIADYLFVGELPPEKN
jgi:uncharacterized iron-regulated protein